LSGQTQLFWLTLVGIIFSECLSGLIFNKGQSKCRSWLIFYQCNQGFLDQQWQHYFSVKASQGFFFSNAIEVVFWLM